ncbi:MAG: NAD-dependent epimerase/dehydratase family protein [Sediminibacterium sp.]
MNKILSGDLEYMFENLTSENDRLKEAEILITGCAGFLGYYFLEYFTRYAEEIGIKRITAVDTFILGRPEWINQLEEKYADILKVSQFDISSGKLSDVVSISNLNFVIHAASIASPTFYRKFPLVTIDANIWGLRNILDSAKESQDLKGILFFSSSEIYGDPEVDKIPTSEEYRGNVSCVGPRACYDESKRFGETLCYVYSQQYKIPITIARPFNNFGPGMNINDKRLPADLANCVINNIDIVLFSDGKPTRTFCYISDAVIGYIKCLVYGKFDYFNIGMDNPEISVQDVCKIYQFHGHDLFGYNGKVVNQLSDDINYLSDNPNRRCPDISKARKLLNYAPKIHVETGVRRYLEFLRYNL